MVLDDTGRVANVREVGPDQDICKENTILSNDQREEAAQTCLIRGGSCLGLTLDVDLRFDDVLERHQSAAGRVDSDRAAVPSAAPDTRRDCCITHTLNCLQEYCYNTPHGHPVRRQGFPTPPHAVFCRPSEVVAPDPFNSDLSPRDK